MSSTPKWYCRRQSQSVENAFGELIQLERDLRCITKRIMIEVKMDMFSEHGNLLEECEQFLLTYWQIKQETRSLDLPALSRSSSGASKRSPYTMLLRYKFKHMLQLNDRRFAQLIFVLKKTVCFLLSKSLQSEIWLTWGLHIVQLYNKCRAPVNFDKGIDNNVPLTNLEEENVGNICSNMYPNLLLPAKLIDYSYLLQLSFEQRFEQFSLDLLLDVFNLHDDESWQETVESNCSSLEIARILTENLLMEEEKERANQLSFTIHKNRRDAVRKDGGSVKLAATSRGRHIEYCLQTEKNFMLAFIERAKDICASAFDRKYSAVGVDVKGTLSNDELEWRGMRLMWSQVGIKLDHILLWWIDNPLCSYSLTHIDSIRKAFLKQNIKDIPEPVHSTLLGVGEILTNFVCNNLWDRFFRYTLISYKVSDQTLEKFIKNDCKTIAITNQSAQRVGTATGLVWQKIFEDLIEASNSFVLNTSFDSTNAILLPVSEQIPILHRIDHSLHCLRLWIKEESKRLCNEWNMTRFFKILERDLVNCLEKLQRLKLPPLTTADLSDILMLVCVALRTKLICEIKANMDNLKKTTPECIQVLSDVCRLLSLAQFNLCFPSPSYWYKTTIASDQVPGNEEDSRDLYVSYVLDHIYLPCVKATSDLVILKLVLKIICEAWLDHIYQRRIRFSVNGAKRLLEDFDRVRVWLADCADLEQQHCENLSNHEVLRMCKGVGKILLRKPEDVIAITQSPKMEIKRTGKAVKTASFLATTKDPNAAVLNEQETSTQLPSEMFVSNQKHWLQLRASKGNTFHLPLPICCQDSSL